MNQTTSDTSKFEIQSRNVVYHDYETSLGDFALNIGKRLISDAEARHHYLAKWAWLRDMLPFSPKPIPALEKTIHFHDRSLPITLASPIILAAGGNKYGENLPHFASMGFGGVTVGSATREARDGNTFRPRVHLLPLDRSMNNSMGLNNPGIEKIARAVDVTLGKCHRRKLAIGISVADTPGMEENDKKISDILYTFRKAYGAADYIELNVSCPNTGTGRMDNHIGFLNDLLREIMAVRKNLVPKKAVLVKLSPDLGSQNLEAILQIISDTDVTGLVLFNTFLSDKARYLKMQTPSEQIPVVAANGHKGGLSGRILYKNTYPAVKFIRSQLPKVTIFACGGIDHGAKIWDLMEAGADAVQCYTALAYRWNAIHKMNRELFETMRKKGIKSLDDYNSAPIAHISDD